MHLKVYNSWLYISTTKLNFIIYAVVILHHVIYQHFMTSQ